MDGWVGRWMDGWIHGWIHGWMDGTHQCVTWYLRSFSHPQPIVADGRPSLSLVIHEVSSSEKGLPSVCRQALSHKRPRDCWGFVCITAGSNVFIIMFSYCVYRVNRHNVPTYLL